MDQNKLTLAIIAIGLNSFACQNDAQRQPAVISPAPTASNSDNLTETPDPNEEVQIDPKCKKNSCSKLSTFQIQMKDENGSKISEMEGTTNNLNTVTFDVKMSAYRLTALRAEGLPTGASIKEEPEVNGESAKISLVWTPKEESEGSFEIIARDVSRCLNLESNDSECNDIDAEGFEKYETTENFAYRIDLDELSQSKKEALEEAERKKEAQCKSGLLQAGLSTILQPSTGVTAVGNSVINCL